MRSRHVATALVAFSAGLSAAAVLRRAADRRPPEIRPAELPAELPAAAAPAPEPVQPVTAADAHDAVVLRFARPVVAAPAPAPTAAPSRCGDSGGVTKAGAPCGARATSGGRCRHHPLAA
jgi:hypothetical protein